MRKLNAVIVCLSLMYGCQNSTITPSFDYASTNLGVYNSGLLNVGQLFVWDTKSNTLTRLDEVPFPAQPSSRTSPTTLVASNISSVSFTAALDAAVKASAAAAIRNNVSITVLNASREEYRSTISLVSNEINRKKSANEDIDNSWLLKRASAQNSGLLYVLVRGLVTSDKAELNAKNSKGGKLSITVPGGKGGSAEIDLSKETLASCTGTRSPCFLSFQVLRAFLNDKGNYDFEPVSGVNGKVISEMLKVM
ncbi:hypothetical protein [Rhizobium laguerreae]|uniref:hypothetical protein n=1 Tax=Rhizobium laguerreae TaxID=1076926 RepID=UPI001C90D4ED|nr:hypothetical protein [Rhizobium laguerreae]MBY3198225.1 hypothetical protein [Rhizobium laguerreae]